MQKKRQTKPIPVQFPHAYISSMMANRFAIQRDDGFVLVHFGLVNREDKLIDSASCVFSDFTLAALRENLLQYSEKLPPVKVPIPAWKPPKMEEKVSIMSILPVVDFVHVTNWADKCAEICLMNYSQGQAGVGRPTGQESLLAWGVALIRCSIEFQASFLQGLYQPD